MFHDPENKRKTRKGGIRHRRGCSELFLDGEDECAQPRETVLAETVTSIDREGGVTSVGDGS